MDQNSNVNLKVVVQGDFPIKYGPKTQKHPWSIFKKIHKPFQNYILKYNGKPIFRLFQILTETLKKSFEQ